MSARSSLFAVAAVVLAAAGCAVPMVARSASRAPFGALASEPEPPPRPTASAVAAPEGLRVEAVVTDLHYPSSVEVDPAGNLYVAEAGATPGDPFAPARVLRISPDGRLDVLADHLLSPVTDLLWYRGGLLISHRGAITRLSPSGERRDLVTGLPSWGAHSNGQLTLGPDGKLYVGQGTATNSGVVGLDDFLLGWLARAPDAYDRLPFALPLEGEVFETPDPFRVLGAGAAGATAATGGLSPFGHVSSRVSPTVPANGTILRLNPDGSDLEVFAWGLRHPVGLQWGPDGRLYATEAGFEERGSRPVANDLDDLYAIERDAWYGWPDFASGVPVTDERFRPADGPAPRFLLAEHPPVQPPLMSFPARSGVAKLAFDLSGTFGPRGSMYVAQWGPRSAPPGDDGREAPPPAVLRVDLDARAAEVFLGPAIDAPEGAGLRRPVDVVFSDDGQALYVVDAGVHEVVPGAIVPRPHPATGVLWRVVPAGVAASPPARLSARPGGSPASGSVPAGSPR